MHSKWNICGTRTHLLTTEGSVNCTTSLRSSLVYGIKKTSVDGASVRLQNQRTLMQRHPLVLGLELRASCLRQVFWVFSR